MNEFKVRLVKLEPLRVASVHGFGQSPEDEAWQKLMAWAKPKGYLDDKEHHRIFGFNNPNPSPGSPNYGYEFWMVVGPEVQPEGEVEIKEFPGGLYAVARCDVQGDPWRLEETGAVAREQQVQRCQPSVAGRASGRRGHARGHLQSGPVPAHRRIAASRFHPTPRRPPATSQVAGGVFTDPLSG
jgi:hypothetical protein